MVPALSYVLDDKKMPFRLTVTNEEGLSPKIYRFSCLEYVLRFVLDAEDSGAMWLDGSLRSLKRPLSSPLH